jgi:hypothetical protein
MKMSVSDVASSYSFRCDAKQAERRFRDFDKWIAGVANFTLGDVLPEPFVKGSQPEYADEATTGITVITTLAIQNLAIDPAGCRIALSVDFGDGDARRPRASDVLLTVDGGPSIGKPVLFDLTGDYAIDSHVAILRPSDIEPTMLVHLLASPLGQLQFQRAESGASGQTAVTEDDIRRFRFPAIDTTLEKAIADVKTARADADRLRAAATEKEDQGWEAFLQACAPGL